MKTELSQKEKQEMEANYFALALLMPKDRFLRELKGKPIDLGDENCNRLKELAEMFGVSTNAVMVRISMLNPF